MTQHEDMVAGTSGIKDGFSELVTLVLGLLEFARLCVRHRHRFVGQ